MAIRGNAEEEKKETGREAAGKSTEPMPKKENRKSGNVNKDAGVRARSGEGRAERENGQR
ncbi:hypothetical protein Dda_7302 [Drechslerella dactyloides]|uniref:Uncharacterized protein n=1 Tax=Drechslerella dactyloides TaxID=74499 RepID=A0AAD6IW75_DREDA|nr:hypothetical protein Dda_7302 [Drechslerella dactyloides]